MGLCLRQQRLRGGLALDSAFAATNVAEVYNPVAGAVGAFF